MKTMNSKALRLMSTLALLLTVFTVNSACGSILHQPKLPDAALKYKK